ncbi:uncharacterized protein LOC114325823 [Diabrotica virgifera virgifera]|uniref:Uncharacterized protein n=1 Tax=Diabrotica virgifera virgifera TaxID=50390 RepID=A0ABM5ICE4_DIAVI|nr:uncharacterized protein LOC114325823 [Diabrotica virgifera virgifera]
MDSYVCKIVVLRTSDKKVLKPRNVNTTLAQSKKVMGIKKCLFGVASIEDTERMLQEQYEIDTKRFNDRFGIDLRKLEESENFHDTDRMLHEQCNIDRKRFNDRFGIDLRKLEENENQGNCENLVSNSNISPAKRKAGASSKQQVKRSREVFRQRNNQTVLTDFYQARKTVQSIDKSLKDSKEN